MEELGLKSCDHQVGGHMKKDGNTPDTLIDDKGRFYKPYQNDARNLREAAFYSMMWGSRGADADGSEPEASTNPLGEWGVGEMYGPAQGQLPKPEDAAGLRTFIPKFYGVTKVEDRQYMIMEDICRGYTQPCVIDAKIGFSTLYTWADEKYQKKVIEKDATTTQSTAGFRISGVQVWRVKEGEMHKAERQWGKTLTKDTIHTAFELFASNGALSPRDLYFGPQGAMARLQAIRDWFATQASFCFYQASVLLSYEGTATRMEDANVQVHLIDFAHTFPTGGKRDDNFLSGLDALLSILKTHCDK
eukprot:CAMPEP_0202866496 /NCGR_PEP_ID=MMETSP1391-20130828/7745_1 /ASSEMBLY_ACC=CAM_ASM_000867 /TAXON_ID=1034604 /ORGANISM="Chlamydomonas leiostraca, Strain SAG 11-49" /LENGTH=302 /DNA_ID=CAMNT_0049546449 /DNA_START=87 /DNA_END=995 /DNA_ORIENTATION=+